MKHLRLRLLPLLAVVLPLAAVAQTERQDLTSRLVNPSFETGTTDGWITSTVGGTEIGARENSIEVYATSGCDGLWLFNTWYSANDYTFVAPNQFVEQQVNNLPAGEYRLVALAASDTYASVKTPIELFANTYGVEFVPPHKSTFTEYELPFFVSPQTLNVKLGMRSRSWFKADHFRLYYLGETDAYHAEMERGEGGTGLGTALVDYHDGYYADGWTLSEIGAHTHGDFPIVTNNMDETIFEASRFQYWTGMGYQLGNARLTYSYEGLTPGWYEFRSKVRVYDENGDFDGTAQGLYITANTSEAPIEEGSEITAGGLSGKGFMGEYRVMAEVGDDGRLTVGFHTQNASFNWLAWTQARVIFHGSNEPIDDAWFHEYERLVSVAGQAENPGAFTDAAAQALAQLRAARTDSEAEAIVAQLRSAVLELVKTSPARDGLYDLSALIVNGDLTDGSRGWTTSGADLRCSEAGVGNVTCTASSASVRQVLSNMPAGHYTLMAQGFSRPTDPATYMHDYEQGIDRREAYLTLNGERVALQSIMAGRRYNVGLLSGITAAIDGRGVPESKAAVPTWFELGDYWNSVSTTLDADGTLDLGIDIAAAKPAASWTAFGHFRLLYGNEVPEVTLSNDDTELDIRVPTTAHVVLQRMFTAGAFVPLCLPFDLTADMFDELYGVGSSDEKTATIYRVGHVRAGEPCVVRMMSDTEAIDFGTVVLSPAQADSYLLPWGGGELRRNYIRTERRDPNYSWQFVPMSKTTAVSGTALSFLPLDPMHMNFTAHLENMSARRFLSENTYTLSSESKIRNYYRTAPPMRRDTPNPVMVPTMSDGATELFVEWSETPDFATAQRRKVLPGEPAYVPNLVPQRSYYYRVVADGETVSKGSFLTDGRLRMIYAPSANNIRDLGGWPTIDLTKRLAYGRIFRGSELNGAHVATDYDLQVLRDLGIDAEIDLRWNASWDNDGVGISAFGFGSDKYYFAAANDWLAEDFTKEESQRHWREEFQLVLQTLRRGKALYFHCVWGADRTGLFSMLLEGILGMHFDAVFKNYELTSYSLAGLRLKNDWQDRIEYINGLEGTTLRDKFENYFINTLGISKDDIDYFRSVMLEDVSMKPEVIDERIDYVCNQNGKTDATVVISLKAGERNAVVLPFSINSAAMRKAFGSGSSMESIKSFDGQELVSQKLYSSTAHVPFILTPASVNEDNTYQFTGITLVRGGASSIPFDGGRFYGVYETTTDLASAALPGQTFYVLKDNHFCKADEAATLKGLHAYLQLNTTDADVLPTDLYFQGETPTGIDEVKSEKLNTKTDGAAYDLTGRRVATPTKGLYIIGGRKVLK